MGKKAKRRSILKLLGEKQMIAVVDALPTAGEIQTTDLEDLLPGVDRSLLHRRLDRLVDNDLVIRRRVRDTPPSTYYRFAMEHLDRELLVIPALGRDWELAWDLGVEPHDGRWAIRTVGRQLYVPLVGALADGRLRPSEVERGLEDVSHAALMRELQQMDFEQLLVREEDAAGTVRYGARDSARLAAVIAVQGVRVEWLLGRPVDPAYASDLSALVHALAPLVRMPPEIDGSCHLHVDDCPQCREPDVYVSIDSGRLIALGGPPAEPPRAAARATPKGWCDALLLHCPRAVQPAGSLELLGTVLNALSSILVPNGLRTRLVEC